MNSATTTGFDYKRIPFFALLAVVFLPLISPGISLLCGLLVGLFFIQPAPKKTKNITKLLLQFSIVGLGFGMNLFEVAKVGSNGFLFTLISLVLAMLLGYLLGRWMRLDKKISYLISIGTAICGGSAIAAVSQVMKADEHQVSVSIGIVFILNAIALFVFPWVGHLYQMDQHAFGLWSAIAIHDTSSVVGAASHYGGVALQDATTVKLARALWIIPATLVTAYFFQNKESRFSFPWFILFFLVASGISTYLAIPAEVKGSIVAIAKTGFRVTLFLIGTGISKSAIRAVGARPMLHGIILWLIISAASLFLILNFSVQAG
jgi:uncharacterized integral membrane protein (TIGR00698 family)